MNYYYIVVGLSLSVVLNLAMIWYAWKAVNKLLYVSDNIFYLHKAFTAFSNHLSDIHQMETFYGDETLEGLIKHSKRLKNVFEEFEDIRSLTDVQEQYDSSVSQSLSSNQGELDLYATEEEINPSTPNQEAKG